MALSRAAFLLIVVLISTGALADKRAALVVGNSSYPGAPLENPKNDADDVAAALQRLKFDVIKRRDLTTSEFDRAIDDFVASAKDADVALFFFSGHGVRIDQRGYLAPINVKVESESSALRELVAIQEVVSRIESAAKVSVIILDACRDSPLQERARRAVIEKHRGLASELGLPPISVIGSNTLVVYATVPGEVASDGTGRNSPFTTSFLKYVETPNLEVELMFKRVTADVLKETAGKQQPERLSRLQTELVLLPSQQAMSVSAADDEAFFIAKDLNSNSALEEYLKAYPNGIHANNARVILGNLERHSYEHAIKVNTPEAFLNFQRDWPSGEFYALAKSHIDAIQASSKEAPERKAPEREKRVLSAADLGREPAVIAPAKKASQPPAIPSSEVSKDRSISQKCINFNGKQFCE
jgi:uncharacterized caspase-like protein